MAETKLNSVEQAKITAEIAYLYFRKHTQFEISQKLSTTENTISQQMVSYYLRKLQRQWLKESALDFNKAKSRELARINALEMEYWQAWQRSQADVEVSKKKERPEAEANAIIELEKITTGQVGDPRFLQGIERCIEMRSKILGFFAPVKFESNNKLTVAMIPFDKLEPKELEAIMNGEDPAKYMAVQMN
jgi:hypothetical protein